MYKLKNIEEFITESAIQKAQDKLKKANQKADSFEVRARAAREEADYRDDQVRYEQQKERLRRQRDSADNKVEKERIKKQLRELKENWKEEKKRALDRIKQLRSLA